MHLNDPWNEASASPAPNGLGEPLSIKEVAKLLGFSPWSVRNVLIRQGLPHLRTGASGKLVFYREQVTRWVLQNQLRGGRK